jgi:uncharacterized small protein (DUF1192 family)
VERLFLPTHDRNDDCLECGEDCDRSWLCECCEGVLDASQDARAEIERLRAEIADQTAKIKRLHSYNAALSVTSVGELFDIVADIADAIERQEFDRAAHLAAKWREQQ